METAGKLDIERVKYELRCMLIRSEELEKRRETAEEHINKYGMTLDNEYGLAKLELSIQKHELDKKEKRLELSHLYRKMRIDYLMVQ